MADTGAVGGHRALESQAAQPRSQSDRIRGLIRDQILRASLRPGDIVVEAALAQEFAVSKTPVREALQMLAVEGWVTVLPRKGYVVSSLNYHDVREVMDLRLMLEPPLVAAAARNVTEELVVELRDLLAAQFHPRATLDQRLAAATGFHVACARASRNGRAADVVARLTDEIGRLHHLMPVVEDHLNSTSERQAHDAIVAAITSGDPDEAAEQTRRHLAESNAAIVQAFFAPGVTV